MALTKASQRLLTMKATGITRLALLLLIQSTYWVHCAPFTDGFGYQNSLRKRFNTTTPLPVEVVHDFPTGTWIENLAIRRNGQIIATDNTEPNVYLVDPFRDGETVLLATMNDTASLLGIVEARPDIFYLCSANYSSAKLEGYGENNIYKLDMTGFDHRDPSSAKVMKIASLPGAIALDGLTYLHQSNLLLSSDFLAGVVWSINPDTGEIAVPINNTYTRSPGAFGINGLRLKGNDTLYFTNSGQGTVGRVQINAQGKVVGNYTFLTSTLPNPDDLAVDEGGDAYVASFTQDDDGVVFVPREGGSYSLLAGVPGPTACAFGGTEWDKNVLYVSTSGGDFASSPRTVSGKIVKIDVERSARR